MSSSRYTFGGYLRALWKQVRERRNRLGVIWLCSMSVALFVAIWVFTGALVAVIVVGGVVLLTFPLGYVRRRNELRRR